MKKFLILLLGALMIIFVFISVNTIIDTNNKNESGKSSSVCTITKESRQWILDTFGPMVEGRTVEQIAEQIDRYGYDNFTYSDHKYLEFQHFDLDEFIFKDNFHGVCYDFSCFNKCVWVVLSEEYEQLNDVRVYVCDVWFVRSGKKYYHSYNFIKYDGGQFYIDLTDDLYERSINKPFMCNILEVDGSFQDFFDRYGDHLMNIR